MIALQEAWQGKETEFMQEFLLLVTWVSQLKCRWWALENLAQLVLSNIAQQPCSLFHFCWVTPSSS